MLIANDSQELLAGNATRRDGGCLLSRIAGRRDCREAVKVARATTLLHGMLEDSVSRNSRQQGRRGLGVGVAGCSGVEGVGRDGVGEGEGEGGKQSAHAGEQDRALLLPELLNFC